MKRLLRWLFRLLLLAVVLGVALVLLKDTLIKSWAEWRIRQKTGLSVSIRKLEVALLSPTFSMEGFKLYNPPDFGGSPLLDMPEVQFEYDAHQILQGRLHLKTLRLHLAELNIIKNRAGQTNLFAVLTQAQSAASVAPPIQPVPSQTTPPHPAPPAVKPGLTFGGIDRMYLSLGTVRYTDVQQPNNSWLRPINWKDYEVKDIRTAEDARNWGMLLVLQMMVLPTRPPAPSTAPRP